MRQRRDVGDIQADQQDEGMRLFSLGWTVLGLNEKSRLCSFVFTQDKREAGYSFSLKIYFIQPPPSTTSSE